MHLTTTCSSLLTHYTWNSSNYLQICSYTARQNHIIYCLSLHIILTLHNVSKWYMQCCVCCNWFSVVMKTTACWDRHFWKFFIFLKWLAIQSKYWTYKTIKNELGCLPDEPVWVLCACTYSLLTCRHKPSCRSWAWTCTPSLAHCCLLVTCPREPCSFAPVAVAPILSGTSLSISNSWKPRQIEINHQ